MVGEGVCFQLAARVARILSWPMEIVGWILYNLLHPFIFIMQPFKLIVNILLWLFFLLPRFILFGLSFFTKYVLIALAIFMGKFVAIMLMIVGLFLGFSAASKGKENDFITLLAACAFLILIGMSVSLQMYAGIQLYCSSKLMMIF